MSGAVTKTNPVATAEAHWGADMPDWIRALAEACAETSQNKVATRIGRSAGLVSHVLRKSYPGDMASVEELVRGAFMGGEVSCPGLGQIPMDECNVWRRRAKKFSSSNTLRVRMYRACTRCPRFKGEE